MKTVHFVINGNVRLQRSARVYGYTPRFHVHCDCFEL